MSQKELEILEQEKIVQKGEGERTAYDLNESGE